MAVVIETTVGDITVDLYTHQRPKASQNFLKLCKLKYYNYNLFHSIQSGFIAQTGDPTAAGSGGCSLWGLLHGKDKRYFQPEMLPPIKHTVPGLLSMVATDEGMIGSQFFLTLGADLDSLDGKHCVIGEVTEGHDVLRLLNETICDGEHRPYRDVRIAHTVILEDPFDDPEGFRPPDRSPSPSAERLVGGRIAPDEEVDEFSGKTEDEITEMIEEKEAKARATILEIVGDLPDADVAPPENVLFVCKLNPVTNDDDLEIIFGRFGKIVSCEVIRDRKTGDSLQYAFVEFEDKKACEDAYFKMDNVLIDDRRIHVDFSQSVSKIKWKGKGRGVVHYDDDGRVVSNERKIKGEELPSGIRPRERNHSNGPDGTRNRKDLRSRNGSSNFERNDRRSPERRRSRSPLRNERRHREERNRSPRRESDRRSPRREPDRRSPRREPDRKSPRRDREERSPRRHRDRRSPRRDRDRRSPRRNCDRRSRDNVRNSENGRNRSRSRTPEKSSSYRSHPRSRDDREKVANDDRSSDRSFKKYDGRGRETSHSKSERRLDREHGNRSPLRSKRESSPKRNRKPKHSSSSESSSDDEKRKDDNKSSKKRSKQKSTSDKKSKKTRSKKVPSSSSSSGSGSSSSTSSGESSSTSDSSDSGHEQSRKKSKNKKSVREKSLKKSKR